MSGLTGDSCTFHHAHPTAPVVQKPAFGRRVVQYQSRLPTPSHLGHPQYCALRRSHGARAGVREPTGQTEVAEFLNLGFHLLGSFQEPQGWPLVHEHAAGRHRRPSPFGVGCPQFLRLDRAQTRSITQDPTAFRATENEARILSDADQHASCFHPNTAWSCHDVSQWNVNGVIGEVHAFVPRWRFEDVNWSVLSTVISGIPCQARTRAPRISK